MDLEALVEDLGHVVIGLSARVAQAISLLEMLEVLPDAAIVDANLGGESARPVVEAFAARGIPTIIASGYKSDELEKMGIRGATITKPYNARAINEALEKLFAKN
ncbi:MAG: response regulator [Cypionkella sp.]|nr:response regulator [Cypionkella sp.]